MTGFKSHAQQMLQGSAALDQPDDARYINLLKTLNRYYDRAGHLKEVAPRLRKAYELSRAHRATGKGGNGPAPIPSLEQPVVWREKPGPYQGRRHSGPKLLPPAKARKI